MSQVDILLPGEPEVHTVNAGKVYPLTIKPAERLHKQKLKSGKSITMMWEKGWGETHYLPLFCSSCGSYQNQWLRYDVIKSVRYTGTYGEHCYSKKCTKYRELVR